MDHPNNRTEITFSLTFLQRCFNPTMMLVYRVWQSLGAILIISVFFMEDLIDIIDIVVPCFFTWIVILILWRLLFLGVSTLLQNRKAARCIVLALEHNKAIGFGAIGFGRKKIEYWIQYKKATIHRGLFGANIIRTDFYGTIYFFVVPESAISLSKLRELVEVDEDVSEKV